MGCRAGAAQPVKEKGALSLSRPCRNQKPARTLPHSYRTGRVLADILYSHFADLKACYLCAQISKYSSRNISSFFIVLTSRFFFLSVL